MTMNFFRFLMPHRQVSTGLAAVFNKLHINSSLKRDSLYKRTGLFGIDQLQGPEGFIELKNNALTEARCLVDEIVHHQPIQSASNQQYGTSTTSSSVEKPNVVALFDELSNCLCKVADLAEFVRVGHPQPRFRATAEQASVAISTLVEELNTDRRLYDALRKNKFDNQLDQYVAKLFMFDFEQSGIHLNDSKRKLVLQLNESILKLGSIFAANANQGRLVTSEEIPEKARHLFCQNSGKILIQSLHAGSDNELIRETAYKLYLKPDETQDDILTNLLRCRLRLAQLCGFESYAHRAVKGSIAGTPEVVGEFLDILNDGVREPAAQDYKQMLLLKAKDNPSIRSQQLNAWDVPYYSANFKKSLYNEKLMQCLPYFSVGTCMDGLNMIFNELYGVRMVVDNCMNGELWHNDVIKLSIIDQETNQLLGYIYCDLFERQMKQHQDCHHTIRGGCYLRDGGTYQLPIVVLVLSLPDSNDNNPSLLSPSMVDNLFHEMGHAMHSMMARTKYQHITGTRCSTDLAEVPSILMEFFASEPRVVSKFARHHVTGNPMPDELLNCWIKSKKVFIASETQLQVFYAALDQAFHNSSAFNQLPSEGGSTTTDILIKTQKQYYSIPYVDQTAWQLRFSHLVGYGAKYYSYLVSRAVATAIWNKLFAADPLSRKAGLRYRDEVLAHGGGKPANKIAEDVLNCKIDANFIASNVIASIKQATF